MLSKADKMPEMRDILHSAQENHKNTQGVFILDADGKVIYANERAKKFFNIKFQKPFLSAIPQNDKEKIYSLYEKLSRGEGILYTSNSVRGKTFEISSCSRSLTVSPSISSFV